ncbi:MAG: hypothetical protein JWQ78_415 [Sediminibacterium sp.]|nr:hypothetical protein [Sediminibacterium sp.]
MHEGTMRTLNRAFAPLRAIYSPNKADFSLSELCVPICVTEVIRTSYFFVP